MIRFLLVLAGASVCLATGAAPAVAEAGGARPLGGVSRPVTLTHPDVPRDPDPGGPGGPGGLGGQTGPPSPPSPWMPGGSYGPPAPPYGSSFHLIGDLFGGPDGMSGLDGIGGLSGLDRPRSLGSSRTDDDTSTPDLRAIEPGSPAHRNPGNGDADHLPPRAIPETLPGAAPTTGDLSAVGAHLYKGWAFDVCAAPSLSVMRAWRHSGYGAIGVYIGGQARHCSQPHLTRRWVHAVDAMGWKILPIYVGSQSPCSGNGTETSYPISDEYADDQGADEADDAVRHARRLGIQPGSPIYLDMEAYDISDGDCADPALEYVQAWSRTLRSEGYLAGYYSSANSGITQLNHAREDGERHLPDLMWFAHWDVDPTIYGERRLSRKAWRPHRRIHQFDGETEEEHGGHSLTIDRDYVDAPVAIVHPARAHRAGTGHPRRHHRARQQVHHRVHHRRAHHWAED